MPKVDNLSSSELKHIWAAIKKLQTATPLASTAVERGRLRFHAGSTLLIQDGNLTVSGVATIDGQLVGSGTLTWTGTTNLEGPTNITGTTTHTGTTNLDGPTNIDGVLTINGNTSITGTSTFTGDTFMNGPVDINGLFDVFGNTRVFGTMLIDGATTLADDLTLNSGGKIHAGALTVEPSLYGGSIAFDSGGYLSGAGGAQLTGPGGNTFVAAYSGFAAIQAGGVSVKVTSSGASSVGDFHVGGTSSATGAKTFRINHPTKPGRLLLHGSTESPVSGIEYFAEGVLDANGKGEVVLPDYFDALAKPEGRMALVTGRGFAADWSDIIVDRFTVAGKPHGKYSWLVKAERIGGDFEVEPFGEEAQSSEGTGQANSGQ